jgi:hypothetical protein
MRGENMPPDIRTLPFILIVLRAMRVISHRRQRRNAAGKFTIAHHQPLDLGDHRAARRLRPA